MDHVRDHTLQQGASCRIRLDRRSSVWEASESTIYCRELRYLQIVTDHTFRTVLVSKQKISSRSQAGVQDREETLVPEKA
jgi:hypothetical protein